MVVVDRSVMLGPLGNVLPPNASIVLPDIFFHEAATADEEQRAKDRANFEPMVRKHQANSLLIARHWRDLSKAERELGKPIDPGEAVSLEASNAFLNVVHGEGLDWMIPASDESVEQWNREAAQFIEACKVRTEHLRQQYPKLLSMLVDDRELEKVVCQPAFIRTWLGQNMPEYAAGRWPELLSQFPDVFAAARWGRLLVWSALRYAARCASDKDLGNSYYDAKYLFSASYVGRLATLDKDQAIACRTVFPYVEIFGPRPT